MKKLGILMLGLMMMAPMAGAAEETVEVMQCPMDGYMVATKCPHCGMQMEKKTVKAAEYQAAIEKQQAEIKGRS